MSARHSVVAVLVLVAGAACAGERDDPAVTEAELPRVVLQPADLPRVWVRFDEGRQIGPDAPPGPRADPTRFGRVEGWKARFRRPASPSTTGPLLVESRADLFEDDEGAKRDFELVELDPAEGVASAARFEAASLGDEAIAVAFVQGTGRAAVRYVVVTWRHENVVASVRANGFARSFARSDALEIARKQERRLQAAQSS